MIATANHILSIHTADEIAVESELAEIATLIDTDPRWVEAYRSEWDGAPIGSHGWWSWAATVLTFAYNTRKITMITRDGILNDAFAIWEARAPRD